MVICLQLFSSCTICVHVVQKLRRICLIKNGFGLNELKCLCSFFYTAQEEEYFVSDALKMVLDLNRRFAYVAFSTPREEGGLFAAALSSAE